TAKHSPRRSAHLGQARPRSSAPPGQLQNPQEPERPAQGEPGTALLPLRPDNSDTHQASQSAAQQHWCGYRAFSSYRLPGGDACHTSSFKVGADVTQATNPKQAKSST